jgi:hypothetical protein
MSNDRSGMARSANRVMAGALTVALLTSVHHGYGAQIYATPWRWHAVLVSGLATAIAFGALCILRKRPNERAGRIAAWVFTVTTLVIHIAGYGLFEGGYNHVLKDLLYFGGASPELMHQLFPAPAYELPDDVFFEVTGVLQVAPAIFTGYYLYRFVRAR